jgi:hypothetical protein
LSGKSDFTFSVQIPVSLKAIPEEVEMEEIKVADTKERETKMWTDKYKPL